jgi:NAD(P)-dependent dehydrogenase (short-subunit alcohol dehydrogenase family)
MARALAWLLLAGAAATISAGVTNLNRGKKIKNSAPRPWSPLFAAARATYRRSPLLSAVRAARPQATVLYTFSQLCLERFRVHVTPLTAAVAAAAVLPAPAQRACVRAAAGAGLAAAAAAAAREASLERRATLLDEPRYALVTGCEAPLGAAAAEALAARGYGVVVVAARDGAARAVARRLRQNHGAVCVPVAAPGLGRNAAAAVCSLDEQLARANVTARLDVFVHAPPAAPATASAGTGEGAPPPAADAAERLPDGLPGNDGAALEARCGTAAQLARRFGGAMAARRRGRCGFVVGGGGDASEEVISSADAFTETFAARLRRRLAPDGVGVTVVRRAPPPSLLVRGRFGRRVVDNRVAPEQADGERLVAAVLRGDAHVSLSPGLF